MFACKWTGCQKTYPIYSLLVEHVNDHIVAVTPTDKPVIPSKHLNSSSSSMVSSAKNLSFPKENPVEVDLMSTSDEENSVLSGREDGDNDDDDLRCEICENGKEYEKNLIVLCDGCDLGYHQKCHPSIIPDSILRSEDSMWYCYNCVPATTSGGHL